MSERETKEIVTTSGKKILIKTYLTGRESNEIKRATFAGLSLDTSTIDKDSTIEEKKKAMGRVPLERGINREEAMIKNSVVAFEGATDSPAERVFDLPKEEYDEVVKQIDASLKGNF